MEWDVQTNIKKKTLEFTGGADLTDFKAFVAALPDNLGANQTAALRIELITNL